MCDMGGCVQLDRVQGTCTSASSGQSSGSVSSCQPQASALLHLLQLVLVLIRANHWQGKTCMQGDIHMQ